jgi:hypothetical protein
MNPEQLIALIPRLVYSQSSMKGGRSERKGVVGSAENVSRDTSQPTEVID